MDDASSYPPIEPTSFDLIIVGTGLPESILAAAASAAGKTVLHLDPNPFYGGHFASLPLDELTSFLQSQSSDHSPPPSLPSEGDYVAVDLATRSVYSDVEISSHSPDFLEQSKKFNLDLAGPRVLFCADSAVDLMLKSGASQYTEFKSVDGSFMCSADGKLSSVPDSRSAIFRDTSLVLVEKTRLGAFFKLVQGHLEAVSSSDEEGKKIAEEDLESPFVDFLNKMRLSPKIKSIILHAIAMADYDQENMESRKHLLKTKDGIDRLALYHSSVGRFPNAFGAMIYPIYGQGELPQAFCRRAAVKGCIYVLRMPVNSVLVDKDNANYKGVKIASGQELFSHQMLLGPSFVNPSSLHRPSSDTLQSSVENLGLLEATKVARGICITKSSLKPNVSTLVVVFPPKSLYPEQVTSVRAVQIGSNLAVCPSGMFVLYLSALCDDGVQGKRLLQAAIDTIFSSLTDDESENAEAKPTLLWSALYVQETTKCLFGPVSSTIMPDGNLNYSDVVDATKELFHNMFPHEEFFPKTAFSAQDDGDDGGVDMGGAKGDDQEETAEERDV